MRPTGIESLNALRYGIAEVLTPELHSAFAQDTASVLQMLLESLSAEWDTAADNLRRDNGALRDLLERLRPFAGPEAQAAIDGTLDEPEPDSVALSALAERNNSLRGALEMAMADVEDRAADGDRQLQEARSAVYQHLREVAGRGWSFWDVASFREYMMRYRTQASQ